MRIRHVGLAIVTASSLGLASLAAAQPPDTLPAEWREFRQSHPFHLQGVAVSPPRPDGSRVVIVAEPPPHMTRQKLSALLSPAQSIDFPHHPIGYDGWVSDAVAVIPPRERARVDELV